MQPTKLTEWAGGVLKLAGAAIVFAVAIAVSAVVTAAMMVTLAAWSQGWGESPSLRLAQGIVFFAVICGLGAMLMRLNYRLGRTTTPTAPADEAEALGEGGYWQVWRMAGGQWYPVGGPRSPRQARAECRRWKGSVTFMTTVMDPLLLEVEFRRENGQDRCEACGAWTAVDDMHADVEGVRLCDDCWRVEVSEMASAGIPADAGALCPVNPLE